jgi:hypothetical protein
LNSGHSRATAFVPRVIGGVRVKYSTCAAIAIAALGRPLPATLEDRCITVRMRRKKRDEMLERFSLHHTDELTELARKCHRWSINNGAAVRAADPEIPKGLSDRAADNVRILLAIADVARGTWPERARRAVEICCSETDETEDETAIVRDVCQAFEQHKAGRMRSVDLARELTLLDRRRYPGLTANALARQLDLFEIRPQTLRMGTQTPRGYERTQFDDAMERYAISLDDGPTPPCATHRNKRNTCAARERVHDRSASSRGNLPYGRTHDRGRGYRERRCCPAPTAASRAAEAASRRGLTPPKPPTFHYEKDPTMTLLPADLPDLWWAEPCAGTGNILRQMPAERRIGWDINPQDNGEFGIIQADYREQLLDPIHKWGVLSNPAFGNNLATSWAARKPCSRGRLIRLVWSPSGSSRRIGSKAPGRRTS